MTLLESLVIFAIGLIPALFSLFVMRKADMEARERLQTAMNRAAARRFQPFQYALSPDHHYVEGIGYMMGDLTCQFNARSSYLRCAINPSGPCQECPHYESIQFESMNTVRSKQC